MTDNEFHNKDGDQNIAQGKQAVGKQENAAQQVNGDRSIMSGTGNVTVNYGVPSEVFARYAGELAVTDAALSSFFKILEEQQVPRNDLDSKLREIARNYKFLLKRLKNIERQEPAKEFRIKPVISQLLQIKDPIAIQLRIEVRHAIETADYVKAEDLLQQAEAYDMHAIEELNQNVSWQRRFFAAASCIDNARLQEIQLYYAKAGEYWQKAVTLLPPESRQIRSICLNHAHRAGCNLHDIAKYTEALFIWEQNLVFYREFGDRAGEGRTLNNISGIHCARGDYDTALKYLEQSLSISQEIGDRDGEGTTLNNLATTAYAKGDYDTALKYLEQSLSIRQEIGDRRGEAETSWNIGCIYEDQGDLAKAEQYMSKAVQIAKEIGHPKREEWGETLELVRTKLRGR